MRHKDNGRGLSALISLASPLTGVPDIKRTLSEREGSGAQIRAGMLFMEIVVIRFPPGEENSGHQFTPDVSALHIE